MLVIFTKGLSESAILAVQESTRLRSNGTKVVTVYVGSEVSRGYIEHRRVVTDVGELAGLRINSVDLLLSVNQTDLLFRAVNIPAPIMGQRQNSLLTYTHTGRNNKVSP